jgi:hypothetical protein
MGQQNIINRSTSTSSNKYVPDIEPGMKEFAVVGNAAAQVGKKLGGNSSLWDWMSRGFGWLFGGGASNVISGGLQSGSMDAIVGSRKISEPSGGGLGGFIKNIFSSGENMMGAGSLLTGIGGFIEGFTDRSDEFTEKGLALKEREIDIYEALGKEGLEINRMKAEDAIKRTASDKTFMGWGLKQLDYPGVYESTPGLVVGDAPTQVASNSAGIIDGNNQGMITQANQRRV